VTLCLPAMPAWNANDCCAPIVPNHRDRSLLATDGRRSRREGSPRRIPRNTSMRTNTTTTPTGAPITDHGGGNLGTNGGRVTHFLAGLGTSGTFVARPGGLRNSNLRCRHFPAAGFAPAWPGGFETHGDSRVPGIYDASWRCAGGSRHTRGRETARLLAKTEGLFVGISSGANVCAALRLARALPHGSV